MYCRVAGWLSAFVVSAGTLACGAEPRPVEFNRDVRPILSDFCIQCHGPDEKQRKADLRLDIESGALADHDGHRAVVPGNLSESELIQRVTSTDENERMPPAKFARQLSAEQIDILKRWIKQGAGWQKHWSLIPPQKPVLPPVKAARWCRTPIDHFVLARLEKEGLAPAAEADKTTLLRRVTLDLTGLPPTVAEVEAFLADSTENAYEKVVNRLLDSPRFGERMATRWLDGARYADTSGYQSDGERYMWRWRDWVIEAYNRNLPFDQFTIEQLAGDLLPNPTLDQRIATGFNRNHRGNGEGGIVPEEYAVEYVVDRVDTTYTVWMGLTMGCARCHDHKFDALTQREYYETFALFNNLPEKGRAAKYGNSEPYISAPTRTQQQQIKQLDEALVAATEAWKQAQPELDAAMAAWEPTAHQVPATAGGLEENLVVHVPFNSPTQPLVVAKAPPTGIKLRPGETPFAEPKSFPETFLGTEPVFAPGPVGQALQGDGKVFYQAGTVAGFGFYDAFTAGCWIQPGDLRGGTIVSKMVDTSEGTGWSLNLIKGKLQVHLTLRWLDDALRVEASDPLVADKWQHVMFTYDGSRSASGVTILVDGKAVPTRILLDELNQNFVANEPLRIGGGNGPDGRFHGLIDEVRIYSTALDAEAAMSQAVSTPIAEIAGRPAAQRSPADNFKLRQYFLEHHLPEKLVALRNRVRTLQQQHQELLSSIPTVMVMEELSTPRNTHVLLRGEYDKKGEPVRPSVPVSLTVGEKPPIQNRLDFAQWLVSPQHPLTSRVAVNRAWQMYFGTGLVKTVDDFGTQGEWPSHPELLDWLASDFVSSGWNVKELQKQIVMSATYRQSSKVTPELLQRDPENRLLARGPRIRLSAEMIRDQALFASGLLVEQVGGPSVLPYQPEGLWKDLTGTDFVPEHGASLYRRSMYTFWKRTVAPPGMVMFDAPTREACTVRETRTNTPLQALNLMNDVTYVETARVLAQRAWHQGGTTPVDRLTHAFQLVLSRKPHPREQELLVRAWEYHRDRFTRDPENAKAFSKLGETAPEGNIPIEQLAAYSVVAQILLNLDEAVTKQ